MGHYISIICRKGMQVFLWANGYCGKGKQNNKLLLKDSEQGVPSQDARTPGVFSHIEPDRSHKEDDIRASCAGVSKEPTKRCFEKKKSSLTMQNQTEVKQDDQFFFKFMTTKFMTTQSAISAATILQSHFPYPFSSLLFFTSLLLSSKLQHLFIPR